MATGLGLTVGSMHAAAVTDSVDGDAAVRLVPTALVLTEDGASLLPPSGRPHGAVVAGYAHRVGDPVALIADDGAAHTGEDLVATTMRCLADGLPRADAVVAAHPATWSGYQADALAAALDRADLPGTVLVPEPLAAGAWLRHTRPTSQDAPIVVYDLGAGSLDVTVVGPGGHPEVLGTPLRSEDYAGDEFDHATMRYVLDAMADDTAGMDPFDAGSVAALTELRSRCRIAKEALSSDTATVIAVDLPGVRRDVRLVREELEDLIREPLADSVNLVNEAVRGAGLDLSDIGLVLLVGGSSAIPLVTELLSAALRLPVVADIDPSTTTAAGAALLAVRAATAAPVDTDATTAGLLGTASPVATDTAAFAMLGAALADDTAAVPAVPTSAASTATAPTTRITAPTTRDRRAGGLGTPKKAALISAAAATLVVLAAGGLSLGTGAFSGAADPQQSSSTTAPRSTTGAVVPEGISSGTAPVTAPGVAGVDTVSDTGPSADADTRSAATAGGTGTQAGAAHTQSAAVPAAATRPAAPGTIAPPAAPAPAPAPAPQPPAPQPPVRPAPNPAPAPVPPPGPSAGELGQGVGNAANGVGQGLGEVANGVGQGVGGVVDGLGGVVGGVGNTLGGVVGGVLGVN